MSKLLYRVYPVLINVYTIWMLYLLYFATFRYDPTILFEIRTVPFETIDEYATKVIHYDTMDAIENLLGNIILFIPYGFLGILYPKLNKIFWLVITFFITINIVEYSQYYFKRGFADVDDIILNTTGVIIGFFIYKSFFYIKDK